MSEYINITSVSLREGSLFTEVKLGGFKKKPMSHPLLKIIMPPTPMKKHVPTPYYMGGKKIVSERL